MAYGEQVDDNGDPLYNFNPDDKSQNTGINGGHDNAPTVNTPTTPPPAAASTGGYDRTRFRDEWQSGKYGHTPADLQAFIQNHPDFASGVTVSGGKGDKVNLPSGERDFDVIEGAGEGGKRAIWGVNPGGTSAADTYGNSFTNNTQGGPNGYGNDPAVYQAIMRLLARGEAPISADDPNIQAQFQPQANAIRRGADQTRQAAAERGAAEGSLVGGGGGAFDSTVNSINENAGEQQGQAMGKIVTSELAGRRQDVANALGFAQGEEKMQLQEQLAQIDAELRRRQMDQQNSQFYDQFAYNAGEDDRKYDYLYDQLSHSGGPA